MDRLALLTLLCALMPGVESVFGEEAASTYSPLVIRKTEQTPKVDGKLDELCWRKADQRALRHYAGRELKVGGSVALCYDRKNLYAALWLKEPMLEKIRSAAAPDGLWNGEVIEWFICPSEDGLDYFQLAWNPAGRAAAYRCRSKGAGGSFQSDRTWQPKWKRAAVVGKKGWTTEAVIPLSEMGLKAPKDGAVWRINLCRHRVVEKDGDKPQWSALSPTGTSGFHSIDRFEDVYFGKYVEIAAATRRDGPLKALIGCWNSRFGYGAIFDPHGQLDRALGSDHVQIRVKAPHSSAMAHWPKRAHELSAYHVIVLTDVPATAFSVKQLQHLRRYVTDGGTLILMGAMGGWKHKPEDGWYTSPLGDLMPLQHTPRTGRVEMRQIQPVDVSHPLLRGLPLADSGLCAGTQVTKPTDNANVIAVAGEGPFIAEKKAGKGRVIQITGHYAHKATWVPISDFKRDFFMSASYPAFWDNLVQYATGKPVAHSAARPTPKTKEDFAVSCDVIRDNYGYLFAPGDTISLKPNIKGRVDYPYEVDVTLRDADGKTTPAGRYALKDAEHELRIELPYLDRGRYAVRLDVKKNGKLVDSADAPIAVTLPLLAEDEFGFSIIFHHDYMGEVDMRRIVQELKSVGFTGVAWVGSHIYGSYNGSYRMWTRSRNTAIIQEAGLRTAPVWYAGLLDIHGGRKKAGTTDRTSGRRVPEMAFPDKDHLPYAHFWQAALHKLYGRMPLTESYAAHDEIGGLHFAGADGERLKKAFETATGVPAGSPDGTPMGAYQFMKYKLKAVANYAWLSRSVNDAHSPHLHLDCIISPNSLGGHSSPVLDVAGTASSLGATSPDVYHYGEQKLYVKSLSSMAIIWSATDFGRLSRPGFTGGNLNNAYYMEFPEQVFAAISCGTRNFQVFSYGTTSFEKNGRKDSRFAEIARRTTAEAGRIGRTLNHCDRSRARVAMLYPHTAHMWLSMGKAFNDDYLEMTGNSRQYLGLAGGVQAQYDVLRKMFGHVDVLFDEQVQRGDLGNYDLCVLGYSRQTEARTLRELRRFAERGGTILVSSDSARLDEYNRPTDILTRVLPATVGPERIVSTDYSSTRITNQSALFSRGNALEPKPKAAVLFTFADKEPACVSNSLGGGEAFVLGMPIGALRAEVNKAKMKLLADVLNLRVRLISKPDDGEFSAVTFLSKRGDNRIFMIANHNKKEATTRITASSDADEAEHILADIVTGEKVPFTVMDDELSFKVTCPDRWGRALALLPVEPASIQVSASVPADIGSKLLIVVRILGADAQPLRSTLPFDLEVKDPSGAVRDDLSGVRVADRGVYVFAMEWPVNARRGEWTVSVRERISGHSDEARWQTRSRQ